MGELWWVRIWVWSPCCYEQHMAWTADVSW